MTHDFPGKDISYTFIVTVCFPRKPVIQTSGGLWCPTTGLQDGCRILFDSADRNLHPDFSLRNTIDEKTVLGLGGGSVTRFHHFRQIPDFGRADSFQSCSGVAYRKGKTVWLSWNMSVIGGKKFMEDVLAQYHFPADPKFVRDCSPA